VARYRRFDEVRAAAEPDTAETEAIASARLRRAGLKSAMSNLELAIAAAAPGRLDAWTERVRNALATVHEEWTRHVVETESPGAFLDELVEEAPRLANQATKLREEHGDILTLVLGIEDRLGEVVVADPDAWVEEMRTQMTSLLAALARHRQRGADLVYEAYDVDIGGGA
jgi:hypothetical protein